MSRFFIFSFLLFLVSPFSSFAQQELGLHFMQRAPQANLTNPAILQQQRISIGLPGMYLNGIHTGFSLNELATLDEVNKTLSLDLEQALQRMNPINHLRVNGQIDLLSVGVRLPMVQIGVSTQTRYNAYLGYPKSLLELAWYGNAAFIGETLDIAPDVHAQAWHEFGISGAFNIGHRLQLGAKVKYLIGIADVSTGHKLATFTTHSDHFPVNLALDYQIQTSVLNFGDIDQPSFSGEFQAFTGNAGLGIDLGAQIRPIKKLTLSASVTDLGYIRWKDQAQSYRAFGSVYFEGLDIAEILSSDSIDTQAMVDSLLGNIDLTDSATTYTTYLSPKIYLSGSYQLLNWLRVGALFHSETYREQTFKSLALNASADLGKVFSTGITYSIRNHRYDNLGLYGVLKLGPVMTYLSSDNLLTFFLPERSQHVNIRAGMNIVFGKAPEPKRKR
ncbi:MAG: DUF5723 family protein [Bacteroidota bacterium]